MEFIDNIKLAKKFVLSILQGAELESFQASGGGFLLNLHQRPRKERSCIDLKFWIEEAKISGDKMVKVSENDIDNAILGSANLAKIMKTNHSLEVDFDANDIIFKAGGIEIRALGITGISDQPWDIEVFQNAQLLGTCIFDGHELFVQKPLYNSVIAQGW